MIHFIFQEHTMNSSLFRIFLQLVLVASFGMIGIALDDIFADDKEIISKRFSLENTSIIEFTNNGPEDINTIRIWLDDSSFNSFKTQDGWISPIASPNTITFTASEPLKTNEIVKFGIKTVKSNPFIQWEALNKEGNQIETGKIISHTMPSFQSIQEQKSIKDTAAILSNSTFKVIPKNLHPGSTIRVMGDNFVPNSSLKLFFSDTNPKYFVTDENGHFVLTMKIPKNMKSEQVNFVLKDKQENEKTVSLYISEIEQKTLKTMDFTVSEIQNKFYRSDNIGFSGTANPNTLILMTIKNSKGNLFSTETINTNSKGDWSTSIPILYTTPIGKYSAEITDGKNTIIESWDVVMSKKIHIFPTKSKFKSEELITFNGTANPNERISIIFVSPQGNEVLTQNFIVNPSGFFEIEYTTLPFSSKGTYVLYAFQEHESEMAFVGLDAYPKKNLSTQLNDINYQDSDVAIIGITGESLQDVTLSVMDDNDHEKIIDKIKLGHDGKRNYLLPLEIFSSGVYTVLVSMAGSQVSDVFTVNLQSSHIPIDLDMIKNTYKLGQTIQVTGTSQPNTVIDLFLIDPNGITVNEKETFVDKNGNLYRSTFLIPHNDLFGKWYIRAESGLNSENFEFQVISSEDKKLSVSVTDIISSPIGKFITIKGAVPEKQIVTITINDPNENTVFQTTVGTTESGEFDLLWNAPPNYMGIFSVIVKDAFENTISTVFDL